MPTAARARPSDAESLTPEEVDFGFAVVLAPNGVRAIVAELGRGLRAIKETTPDGTHYAVCDETFRSLYTPAKTIDELRRRFRATTSGIRRARS